MTLPLPQLHNRHYDDLVEEARALIPTLCREWSDYNPTDPGIALIELLAWLTDMLLYRIDRVPPKNYETFLKLLGESGDVDKQKPLEERIRDMVVSLRARERAITAEDIEQLVLKQWPTAPEANKLPGMMRIRRVHCVPGYNLADDLIVEEPGHISVVVMPYGQVKETQYLFQVEQPLPGSISPDPLPEGGLGNDTLHIEPHASLPALVNFAAVTHPIELEAIVNWAKGPGQLTLHIGTAIDGTVIPRVSRSGTSPLRVTYSLVEDNRESSRARMSYPLKGDNLNTSDSWAIAIQAWVSDRIVNVSGHPVTHVIGVGPERLKPGQFTGWLRLGYRPPLQGWLAADNRGPLGTRIHVVGPKMVPVSISARLVVRRGVRIEDTRSSAQDALRRYFHPFDGGPDANGWPLGRGVYVSEIYSLLDRLPGVDYVDQVSLDKGKTVSEKLADGTDRVIPDTAIRLDLHELPEFQGFSLI